jgi:hypothetical protein
MNLHQPITTTAQKMSVHDISLEAKQVLFVLKEASSVSM